MSDLLLVLLRSGAVLALALVAGLLARNAPALRLAVYRLGLLAALGVAVASPWLREAPAPLVPVRWEPAPVAVRSVKAAPAPVDGAKATLVAALPETPATLEATALDPLALASALWLAGSGLLLLRLLFGYGALARARRACRPIEHPEAVEIAREMGVAAPTVVEGAVGGPFVAGARRPTIFLPEGWSPEPDVLRAVLRHEMAHIANGDLRWNPFLRLVGIALWPQPLLWLLKRPMEAAGEELCDAEALASGMPSARYAECLLSLRPGRAPSLGIGAVASRSSLGRRVEAILDSGRSHKTRLSRPTSLALRLGALALAAGAAFVFARPRPPLVVQDSFAGWVQKPYAAQIKVLSAEGKPVVGARAWLVLSGALPRVEARPLNVVGGEVVIGTSGIPEETMGTLVVRAKGHGLGVVRVWPAPKQLASLTLPAPVALVGRVVLPGGKAEGGLRAKVTTLLREGEEADSAFASLSAIPELDLGGTTAADGSFRIGDLPPSFQVGYDVDDVRFAQPRYTDRVGLGKSGTTKAKDLVLRPAARFTGRVTLDGAPVAGVRVAAQDTGANWGEAVTAADGTYAIERLTPATYNVAADLQARPGVTAVAREGVEARAGATVRGLDLALIPGVLIEGRVTDDAGKPVRTDVGVYGPAHPQSSAWVQSAKTDADGRYRLRVPPGEQFVYLMDSTYSDDQRGRKVRVDSGTKTVDFRVPRVVQAPAAPKAAQVIREESPLEEKDPGPVPPIASFGPGRPFYGPCRLKAGGTVRLAYIQNDETASHTLWKGDGGPADPKDVAASLNMKGFSDARGRPRNVYARIEATGVRLDGLNCVVQVPHPSRWNVYQSYGDGEDRAGDLVTFHAPRALKVTDLRLGVGAGPWSIAWSGKPGGFARLGKGGGVSLTVALSPALQRRNVSMRVVDRSGHEMELRSESGNDPDPRTRVEERSYEFQGDPRDIARIDLLARDYEWVTFKGIRLYPK